MLFGNHSYIFNSYVYWGGTVKLSKIVIGNSSYCSDIYNHPNMHMNSEEFTESKKLARIIVLLEFATILGCVLLGADMIYVSYMAIAVILCAALLYISKKDWR